MKIFRNRFFIGTLCIIAALILSFIIVPALNGSQDTVSVVRMTEAAAAGTLITEEMVETVTVPEGIVDGGISTESSVIGMYAVANLYAGDYLTAEKLTDTLKKVDLFSAGTDKGKLVASITLPSLASGVSGRLLPGDIVTVIAVSQSEDADTLSIEPGDTSEETTASTVIDPELQYVEVCMVTTGDGADASVEADPDDDEENSLPVTVSFFVTQEQALLLAELKQEGTIYLAFVARGDDAAQYLPDADRVLNTEVE